MCSVTHPFAVWECLPSGQVLHTLADEDLACQFVMNNGGLVIANPTDW